MKKILFYTANGVGLGHLQRAHLIAEKIRFKNIEIALVTSARSPQIFGKFFHRLIRLIPLSDELLFDPPKTLAARLANGKKLARVFKNYQPDLVIADFYLTSLFTFYPFGHALKQFPVKSIFIWRLGDDKSVCRSLKNEQTKLNLFERIILPHSRQELADFLSREALNQTVNDRRFKICGPIYRRPDKMKLVNCRKKYRISANDFLITITLGGGGKLDGGQCDNPDKVINDFVSIFPQLQKDIPNLRIVVSTGPYFKLERKYAKIKGIDMVTFEPNLLELMSLSKIVICPVGYNTCNELIQIKRPAILIPLMRGNREQFVRAKYFKKQNVAKIYNGNSPKKLLKLILECKNDLAIMESNYSNFPDNRNGINQVTGIILNLLNKT